LNNGLVFQPVSFAAIVQTAYGQMLINRHDINQSNALFKTGFAPHHAEIIMLAQLLGNGPADPVIIDVGANFGTFTLALSAVAGPRGKVHSFEAQRIVHCHNAAVGDREGWIDVPQFDYAKPLNFGSIVGQRVEGHTAGQHVIDRAFPLHGST
jgi:hypothetical protein